MSETAVKSKKPLGKTAKIWLQTVIILAGTFLLIALCRLIPWLADNVYLHISRGAAWLFSWLWAPIPTSAAELLIIAALLLIPVCVIVFTVRLIRGNVNRGKYASRKLAQTMRFLSLLLLIFYFLWGCNYAVSGAAETLSLDVRPRASSELASLVTRLGNEAGALPDTASVSDSELAFEVSEAVSEYTGLPTAPAKPVIASRLMSEMRLTGVFFPFTAESNVNTDAEMPRGLLASSMAHESMHGWGVAHEGDASFLGFAALYEHGNDRVKYSALLNAIISSASRLQTSDPELARETISALPERVKSDISAHNAYWSRFTGAAAEAAETVNDAYLKLQGEDSGTESYGEFVDLLLAYFA